MKPKSTNNIAESRESKARLTKILLDFYNRYFIVFWIVFGLIALRASYYSFLTAIGSSLDMQWYPAVQLWTSGGGGK